MKYCFIMIMRLSFNVGVMCLPHPSAVFTGSGPRLSLSQEHPRSLRKVWRTLDAVSTAEQHPSAYDVNRRSQQSRRA